MRNARSGDITFADIFRHISAGWRSTLLVMVVLTITLIGVTLVSHPSYTVTLLVKPVDETMDNSSRNPLGAAGALLSLNGKLGSQDFARYLQLLVETPTANILAQNPTIMHEVFKKNWNPQLKKWQPRGVRYYLIGWLYSALDIPAWTPPDADRLAEYLKNNVSIDQSITSDIVTITYNTPNPAFGAELLSELNFAADTLLRVDANKQAQRMQNYLQNELRTTAVQSTRDTLTLLLLEQEKRLMLTQSGVYYAAQAIGRPTFPNAPTWPKPLQLILAGLLGGTVLGLLLTAFTADWLWKRVSSLVYAIARRNLALTSPSPSP